jgi:hypothetical protein
MSIDTDVNNYTLSELMTIANVNDLDPTEITNNTNSYINQFKNTNPTLSTFFQNIQSQLLQYSQGLIPNNNNDNDNNNDNNDNNNPEEDDAIYPAGQSQTDDRYNNEYLTQNDKNQTNKITQRKQKVQVYGNQHDPMTREQLGVNDTYNVPIKQDVLNPNLKNTINRFVNLDSQFRQYSGINSISTDYTLDLSDRLNNTISLSLYSYQIPNSWYVIDTAYNNTCFWINYNDFNIPITIPSGNYTANQFVTTLIEVLLISGFTFSVPPVSYNINNGKITLNLYGGIYNNIFNGIHLTFTIDTTVKIIFYDFTATLICNQTCKNSAHYFNQTLGWIMGYRIPFMNIEENGNIASSVLDLNGTKYLILVIDDYNQNRVNKELVSITQLSGNLKIPNYYSNDLPYTCISPGNSNLNNINNINNSDGLLIANKYENDYTQTQQILPSAPKLLTNSQIYTINEINKNNNNLTNFMSRAPTSSDIMAIIPLKGVTNTTGDMLVDFSGSLQDNERTYFGPVNIDRMSIKLLDDKGNILNLNGLDWTITLIATCLYQY